MSDSWHDLGAALGMPPLPAWNSPAEQIRCGLDYIQRAYRTHPTSGEYGIPQAVPRDPSRALTLEQAAQFYEEDEDPVKIAAAFDAGEKGITEAPDNEPGSHAQGGIMPGANSASGSDTLPAVLDDPEPDEYVCTSCRKDRHACRDLRCDCCAGDSC